MSKKCEKFKKVRYRTQEEAHKRVLILQASDRDRTPSREYYCAFCGGWHITSKPQTYQQPSRPVRNQDWFLKYIDNTSITLTNDKI